MKDDVSSQMSKMMEMLENIKNEKEVKSEKASSKAALEPKETQLDVTSDIAKEDAQDDKSEQSLISLLSNEKEPEDTLAEVPKDLDGSGTKEVNQLNKPTNKILDIFS